MKLQPAGNHLSEDLPESHSSLCWGLTMGPRPPAPHPAPSSGPPRPDVQPPRPIGRQKASGGDGSPPPPPPRLSAPGPQDQYRLALPSSILGCFPGSQSASAADDTTGGRRRTLAVNIRSKRDTRGQLSPARPLCTVTHMREGGDLHPGARQHAKHQIYEFIPGDGAG